MVELKRNLEYFVEGKGKIEDDQKVKEFDKVLEGFCSQLEDSAMEKTESERQAIDFIISKMQDIARNCGVEPRAYNSRQVHFLSDEDFKKILKEDNLPDETAAFAGWDGIGINEKLKQELGDLNFWLFLVHEFFHIFGKNKHHINEQEKKWKKIYRGGVRFEHGKPEALKQERFIGLNEAITQALTNLFYSRVIRKSDFFKPLVEEFDEKDSVDGKWKFPESCASFWPLVHLFEDLCQKIKNESGEKYEYITEVMDEFFKIYFSGDIKEMKPLLDLVGEGCFGDLAEIGSGYNLPSLEKIKRFREKYQLKEDGELNRKIDQLSSKK